MFLGAKRLAFLSLLLACTILLVIFSGILETNSLFLLAGASFGVGIAIRESGLRFGSGFLIAAVLLSFLLAPNKLYCLTFAFMGLYLAIAEFAWDKLALAKTGGNRNVILWVIKYAVFNAIYVPVILFFPKLVYQGELSPVFLAAILLAGQAALFVYDMAYGYFQKSIWGKIRVHIKHYWMKE